MHYLEDVPEGWWRFICEHGHHALACIGEDDRFVWVNEAWCRLLGYSQAELKQKTWIEITLQGDVGGDVASAQELIEEGGRRHYTLSKRYVHKLGHIVKVEITVHRFPSVVGEFQAFAVEAMPEVATYQQLENLKRDYEVNRVRDQQVIQELIVRLKSYEKKMSNSNSESRNNSTINIGNNSVVVAIIIGIVIAICGYLIITNGSSKNQETQRIENATEQ